MMTNFSVQVRKVSVIPQEKSAFLFLLPIRGKGHSMKFSNTGIKIWWQLLEVYAYADKPLSVKSMHTHAILRKQIHWALQC